MNDFLSYFIPNFFVLTVMLILVRLVRFNMIQFSAVYVVASIVRSGALFLNGNGLGFIIIQFFVALALLLLSIVVIGFTGKMIAYDNHQAVIVGFGLYPWYLGLSGASVYIGVAMLVLFISSFIKQRVVAKRMGVVYNVNPASMKKSLGGQDRYVEYLTVSHLNYSMSFLTAMVVSILPIVFALLK